MRKVILILTVCLLLCSIASAEWIQDSRGWWWKEPNGSFPTNAWKQINRRWYFFDSDGYMLTGLQNISGAYYFFETSGVMATGWKEINGEWRYFNQNGEMATNSWVGDYYLDENGKMLTCTMTPDGYRVNAAGKWVDYSKINRAWEEEVVRLTNEFRAQNGKPPLVMKEQLMSAAEIRASELVTLYEHTRPNGTSCSTVLEEVGLTGEAGENAYISPKSPKDAVEGWIKSPGHRENMLGDYTYIGVGCYIDKKTKWKTHWIQMFK